MDESSKLLKISQFFLLALPIFTILGRAPQDITMSIIVILFLVHSCLAKDFSWVKDRWALLCFAFWGYIVATSFLTVDVGQALERSTTWGRFFIFSVALYTWIINSRKISHYLLVSCLVAVGFLAVDSLIQFQTGYDLFGNPKFSENRLNGPYRRPYVAHIIVWNMFPVVVYFLGTAFTEKKWLHSLYMLLTLILLYVAVLLSGARAPFLLSLLGLGFVFLLAPSLRRRLFTIFLLLAGTISIAFFTHHDVFERQFTSTHKTISHLSDSPYGKILKDVEKVFQHHMILGTGAKNYREVCKDPKYQTKRCKNLHPHNFYAELLVETGLIGFCIMLGIFYLTLKTLLTDWSKRNHNFILVGVVTAILIRFWPITFGSSFFSNWNIIPLWMMIGWGFAIVKRGLYEEKA